MFTAPGSARAYVNDVSDTRVIAKLPSNPSTSDPPMWITALFENPFAIVNTAVDATAVTVPPDQVNDDKLNFNV